jgi:hypothetical protein
VIRHLTGAATALVLLCGLRGSLSAQVKPVKPVKPRREQVQVPVPAEGRAPARAGRAGVPADQPLRQQVQQAFRNRVREVLNLDQPKMRQLNQTEQRFNRERADLTRSERETRVAMKTALDDTTNRDPHKIDQYINQLVQIQHQRADLVESEQKELSTFLTPVQRLQYLSLKEQLDQRLREINKAAAAERRGGPPPEPPVPER